MVSGRDQHEDPIPREISEKNVNDLPGPPGARQPPTEKRGTWEPLRGPGILKIGSIALFVASLYVATWVGGTQSHEEALRAQAQRVYMAAVWQENHAVQKDARLPGANQGPSVHPLSELRKGGPRTWVDWSVPLLPGLLLVDSGQIVGPRWGEKGVKLVLYYGFGSTVVLRCDTRTS